MFGDDPDGLSHYLWLVVSICSCSNLFEIPWDDDPPMNIQCVSDGLNTPINQFYFWVLNVPRTQMTPLILEVSTAKSGQSKQSNGKSHVSIIFRTGNHGICSCLCCVTGGYSIWWRFTKIRYPHSKFDHFSTSKAMVHGDLGIPHEFSGPDPLMKDAGRGPQELLGKWTKFLVNSM